LASAGQGRWHSAKPEFSGRCARGPGILWVSRPGKGHVIEDFLNNKNGEYHRICPHADTGAI
jgi:hypothetical protein